MSPDKLVYMANQIAKFFHSRSHDEGVAGVAEHISNFWEPRMRKQLFELLEGESERFDPLVQEAAPLVRPVAESA
ncbi:MAG: formate dehydrogenase subunit delta [Nitratireductor sp.]|nr:formate dehydrogenase subunit delta [Nitratireductor sp.]